ncbi:MAG: ATP-binding protein, partial [Haliscomenobacter sp.]
MIINWLYYNNSINRGLNSYKKTNLLILDDFGIQPIPQQISIILLQILEDRYEANS